MTSIGKLFRVSCLATLALLFAGCAAKKSEGPQAGTDEITASLDGSTPGSITQTGTIDLTFETEKVARFIPW